MSTEVQVKLLMNVLGFFGRFSVGLTTDNQESDNLLVRRIVANFSSNSRCLRRSYRSHRSLVNPLSSICHCIIVSSTFLLRSVMNNNELEIEIVLCFSICACWYGIHEHV